MKNFESLNHSHNPNLKENTLKPKYATRTVLFDENGKVAIINVTKHGYYKIPGGGIEDGEDVKAAACREVREEAGCDCTITDTLGNIETPVPVWDMLDISTGFIATVTGEKTSPQYETWETKRGFRIEWFKDLDTAIQTIENNQVTEPGMEDLQARDLTFLKRAKQQLTQKS